MRDLPGADDISCLHELTDFSDKAQDKISRAETFLFPDPVKAQESHRRADIAHRGHLRVQCMSADPQVAALIHHQFGDVFRGEINLKKADLAKINRVELEQGPLFSD